MEPIGTQGLLSEPPGAQGLLSEPLGAQGLLSESKKSKQHLLHKGLLSEDHHYVIMGVSAFLLKI